MPAFIIFEDTILHVDNKDKATRCHYIMTCIIVSTNISNQWGLSMMSRKAINDHGRETTSLSHWRWNFHASINEVPSSAIKTAGKQRRMTLRHAIGRKRSSRKNSSLHLQWTSIHRPGTNENQQRLTKRNMQLPHPHLLDQMVQRKVKCKGEV